MEEPSYQASTKRIISESFPIWLFLAILVAGNFYLVKTYTDTHSTNVLSALILGNIVFGLQTIGGIIAFINYRKYSINRTVIITNEAIRLYDSETNEVIEIKNSDIIAFEVYSSKSQRPPWGSFEYLCFRDVHERKIVITCFMMKISYNKVENLSNQIGNIKAERHDRFIPLIPE